METKHTPGPWTVNGDHISRLRPHKVLTGRDERGNRICGTEDRPEGIPVARVIFSSKEDGQANARLIAAAPDQIAELIRIEARVAASMPTKHDDLTAASVTFTGADLAKLRAIIAKATK